VPAVRSFLDFLGEYVQQEGYPVACTEEKVKQGTAVS